MPDAFRYMLSLTTENIKSTIETDQGASNEVADQWNSYKSGQISSTLRSTTSVKSSVSPMLKTAWHQAAPYNDSVAPYPTGCVPTAAAQIMKYYGHPKVAKTPNSNIFPKDITYDWGNMLNSYTDAATTAQKQAAATLMYSLIVGMQAYPQGGNLVVLHPLAKVALVDYNGYDSRMGFRMKENMRHKEWVDLIKNEITKGRPVLYMATSSAGSIGHAFVCDGYDNAGLIHINMGWTISSYNVYYNIDSQNGVQVNRPDGTFNYDANQYIFTNIRPATLVYDSSLPYMMLNSDIKISADVVNLGASFETNIAISNAGGWTIESEFDLKPFNGTLGVVLTDDAGNVKHVAAQRNVTDFYPFTPMIERFPTCTAPRTYGTYKVRAAYKATGSTNWTLISNEDLVDYATITLASNNFSAGNLVNLTSFSLVTTKAAQGSSFVPTNMSIRNNASTGEFHGYCAVALTDMSDNVKYILTPNMAGTYTVIRAAATLPFGGYEDCYVPLNAVPGTYRLRLVYKTLGDSPNGLSDWKMVNKNPLVFTSPYVNFTVTAATTRAAIGEDMDSYDTKAQVYPNPVIDILNVSSDVLIKEITIYDMSGKLVLKTVGMGNQQQVDVSSLSNGVYLLKVESLNGTTTHKISKQ